LNGAIRLADRNRQLSKWREGREEREERNGEGGAEGAAERGRRKANKPGPAPTVNLIIAMMGDTYSKDKEKEGYIQWWMLYASVVLKYEKRLQRDSCIIHRCGILLDPSAPRPGAEPFFKAKLQRAKKSELESAKDEARDARKKVRLDLTLQVYMNVLFLSDPPVLGATGTEIQEASRRADP